MTPTPEKKGPGRGGKRAGAGRKPSEFSRRALLSVRVTEEAKAKIEETADDAGITPGEFVQKWAETL